MLIFIYPHDTHLFDPHLSQADGYLVKSHKDVHKLTKKISNLLN
jgi:hypothetical protein